MIAATPTRSRASGDPRRGGAVRLVAIVLLLLAATGGSLAQRIGQEPWQFPDPGALRDAERRYPGYWYENYAAASSIVDSGGNMGEAIARLRLAVAMRPQASLREYNPRTRVNFEYFPYFYLSRAFINVGQVGPAARCLERVQGAEIARSRLSEDFERLGQRLEGALAQQRLQESLGALGALAQRVEGWTRGRGGVDLGAEARERASRISSLLVRVRGATGPQAQNAARELLDELTALCREELAAGRAQLEQLRQPLWSGAFAGQGELLRGGVCEMPAGEPSPPLIDQAQDAVERCSGAVFQAVRTAGEWACADLAAKRDNLQRLRSQQTTWSRATGGPAPSGPAPAIPDACELSWFRASHADVRHGFAQIDLGPLSTGLDNGIRDATSALQTMRAEFRAALEAATRRIPTLRRQCVNDLQLGGPSQALARLRRDPDEVLAAGPPEGGAAGLTAQVDRALEDLAGALQTGVGQMLGERDQCTGLDTSNLDALEGALASYRQSRSQSALDSLCAIANRADADIRGCWQSNTTMVREKVTDYRWLLESAVEGRAQLPAAADDAGADLACLESGLSGLRASAPRGGTADWVRRSRQGLNEAQVCLQLYHEARRQSFEEMRRRLDGVHGSLQALSDPETTASLGSFGASAGRIAGDVSALREKAAGLAGLGEPAAETAPGELRQALQGLDLAAAIPDDWWGWLERLQGGDERYLQAALAVRDQAAGSVLEAAGAGIETWERVAGTLDPFLTLRSAFESFARGELDGAIRLLREARVAGRVPDTGKASALGHAALSYFLFVKSRAFEVASEGSELAGLLRGDAEREAQRAVRADETFRLPENLFVSRSYREFFEDCCGSTAP